MMTDIKNHELLEKLNAGWIVRRKNWPEGWSKSKWGTASIPIIDLIANDWEARPPDPINCDNMCSISRAFEYLYTGGASFIRRARWEKTRRIYRVQDALNLTPEDIMEMDWQVFKEVQA